MMANTKEKKLVKDTIIYFIASFGSKIMLLMVYPVYTYFLNPEELGNYDLIVSTLTLFYPIVVFSINDAIFRWLLDDADDRQQVIAIGMKVAIKNLLIADAALIAINYLFSIQYGWLIIGIINVGALYPVLQQVSRGLRKNMIFAFSGLLYAVSFVGFNILFVVVFPYKVQGLLLSQILAYSAACLFLYATLRELHFNWFKFAGNDQTEKKMIRYSLLLIPNSSCWWIMNASDRYLIRYFIGAAANGIYSVSHKFPSVMNMITSVFSLAWQEQAITEYGSQDRDGYYSKIFCMYYRALLCISVMLMPVTKWFTMLCIESRYDSAWKYCPALYLGSVLLALASFVGTGYLSAKNTKGAMQTSMCGAAVNVLADVVLLPCCGVEAAAISTLLGNAVVLISRWVQSTKYFRISVAWTEFYALIALNLAVGLAIRRSNLITDILMLVVTAAVFLFINRKMLMSLLAHFKPAKHRGQQKDKTGEEIVDADIAAQMKK